uniref:Lysosome-associated membrane glycoprotein 1 n=1 Tax=Sphenodon punctatus TaxID=8508 RepID=A0A8D0G8M1_SPHPU
MACRFGSRWLLLVAAVIGFLQTPSSTFEVKDATGKVCIMANMSIAFSVEYPQKNNSKMRTNFTLPQDAEVLKNSSCDKENTSSLLEIGFGKGHSLSMNFTKVLGQYKVEALVFRYNLLDAVLFPNSTGGTGIATSLKTDILAKVDTRYVCISADWINMTNVNITISNVTLEAYPLNNTFSENKTTCSRDVGPTSAPAPTSTGQTPKTPSPVVCRYNVTGRSGICILASMGLQLNITYDTQKVNETGVKVLNFIPTKTAPSGSCDNSTANLTLFFENTTLSFYFAQNTTTAKFFLHGLSVNTTLPSDAKEPTFEKSNSSMSALGATVGNSYKCVVEEKLTVSTQALLNIFDVQIQVFKIDGDKFGAVEECQQDENNMLIPIIVGAALAGLVLIVLIAYLIGRKRSHAGYQTI